MSIDRKTAIIIVICLIGFISFRLYIAFNAGSFSAGADNRQESFDFPVGLPAVYTGTCPAQAARASTPTCLLIPQGSGRSPGILMKTAGQLQPMASGKHQELTHFS